MVESNTNSNDILNINYLPLINIISYEIYPIYSDRHVCISFLTKG